MLAAGCMLMAAPPASARAPQATDDVTIWAAPDMQKIRSDDAVESENIVWSEEEGRISVAGAGNEHVPFQMVITTPVPEGYEPEAPGGFFIQGSELPSAEGETSGQYIESQSGFFYNQANLGSGRESPFTEQYLPSHHVRTGRSLWFAVKAVGGMVEASPHGVWCRVTGQTYPR